MGDIHKVHNPKVVACKMFSLSCLGPHWAASSSIQYFMTEMSNALNESLYPVFQHDKLQ